ncbi:MAG: hypothetical protein IKT10_04395 [Clostridiales bacterium]|nr:hypothetical protein [Clostridiales bacterium]
MDRNFNQDNFIRDISVEEFDHITDGVEPHVFSDEYLARKDSIMRRETGTKISKLGIKIAAAAAAVVVATPFVANAATGGELFARIWGTEGKKTIESHVEQYIEEGKVDKDGNPNIIDIVYPKIEYVDTDPEVIKRVLADKVNTEPIVTEFDGYTFTINAIVNDGHAAIVDYTIEKKGGVDLLYYSQLENEAKGAFTNEAQPINYYISGGHGKLFVNIEKSTADKLYCTEYLLRDPGSVGLTFEIEKYDRPLTEIYKPGIAPDDHMVDKKSFALPFAGTISNKTYESSYGETIVVSPVSMKINTLAANTLGENYQAGGGGYEIDFIGKIKITYKDGSEYLIYQDIIYDGKHDDDKVDPVASYSYICGGIDYAASIVFNRIVDTDNIASITVNDTEYKLK